MISLLSINVVSNEESLNNSSPLKIQIYYPNVENEWQIGKRKFCFLSSHIQEKCSKWEMKKERTYTHRLLKFMCGLVGSLLLFEMINHECNAVELKLCTFSMYIYTCVMRPKEEWLFGSLCICIGVVVARLNHTDYWLPASLCVSLLKV